MSRTWNAVALITVTLAAGISGGVVGGGAAVALVRAAYNGPTQRSEVPELVVNSRQLQEPISLRIHLPVEYENQPEVRFPVLWVLDGQAQSGHVSGSAQALARAGVTEPSIIVEIPSSSRGRRADFTPPWEGSPDDAQADRFLAFLKSEALPAVAESYRIGDHQILVGHSLGGLFSLYALFEDSSVFDGYFAFSPSVWLGEEAILGEIEGATREGTPTQASLFLSLGDREGNEMLSGFEAARQRLDSFARSQLRWHAEISGGADHRTNPVLSFPAALRWYFSEPRTDGGA